ncbi:MAG: ATP-binding protein, partial [Candidatus Dormibacteria bacterium]
VYASDTVLRHSRVQFATTELEPFMVKGKAAPVTANLVGPMTTSAAQGRVSAFPLVGRDGELAALEGLLTRASAGRGACAEIVGPPGIGKSRLIEALEDRAPGIRVLRVVCDEYRSTIPYASARTLIRQSLGVDPDADQALVGDRLTAEVGRSAPALTPWLPLLATVAAAEVPATPESTALDGRFRNERLEATFVEFLSVLLPYPALLVFDDVQWMDDSSSSLLRRLISKLWSQSWLLVAGRRPQPGGLPLDDLEGPIRLDLQPLSDDAVSQLVRAVTATRPLAPHQRAAISGRSGGNPLFLLELLQTGQQSGSDTALPDSVEALLASQVDRLSPPDRHLLRVASVLGMQVDLEVLADMLDGQHAARRLAALDDFFSPDTPGALRFRHTMLRDAAYEGLPYARRRELHAKAGEVLERLAGHRAAEIAGLLALHFGNAAQHRSAWRYSRLAGDQAKSVYANVEAASFFEQALSAARDLGDVAPAELLQVAEALGDARSRLGEFSGAAVAYRTARRWATLPVERARLLHKVALTTDRAGNYALTLRMLTLAERSLEALDDSTTPRLRAEIRALYGLVRHRQGRGPDAVRLLKDAVSLAEQARASEVLATALLYLDIAELTVGLGDDSRHAQRALELLREMGDQPWLEARALNQLGIRAYFAGNWSEAVEYYTQSRDACVRAGDEWTAAVTAGNIAEVLSDQGHLDQAEAILEDALRTYQAAGTPTFIGYGTMLMGRLLTRRGDFARARPLLQEARDLAAAEGETMQLLQAESAVAECELMAGDPTSAGELAQRVLQRAGGIPGGAMVEPALERVLGLAQAVGSGDATEAQGHLRKSVEASRTRGAKYDLAMSLRSLGELRPDAISAEEADEASRLFEQLGLVRAVAIPPRPAPSQLLFDQQMTLSG